VAQPATAPLSAAQEALYYQALLGPDRITYTEVVSVRREGELDSGALARALTEVVRRHRAWRSTFGTAAGQPVQLVHPPPAAIDLPTVDLSDLPTEAAERRAATLVGDRARVPFDLLRGPLLRPLLVHFPADHHRLYLALHHIIFDGVSLYRVAVPELVSLYQAYAAGRPSPLGDAGADYPEYAAWQQDWVAGPRAARHVDYWCHHLAGAPPGRLPVDHPRPARSGVRGGVVPVLVEGAAADRLVEVGDHVRASLFHVMAATWAIVLSRYAGHDEVVTATAADLRQRPEFYGLVGYCLTPLALRVDLGGARVVADAVTRVRDEVLDGLDHLVPFERVVRQLPGPAPGDGNPVYQTMIVFEPPGGIPSAGWSLHLMDSEVGDAVGATHGLDLELQLDHRPGGEVAGRLIYDADRFERTTAARIAADWVRVVDQVAAGGGQLPLDTIEAADSGERRLQVAEWNATRAPMAPATLPHLLAGRAADIPAGAGDPPAGARSADLARWLAAYFDLGPGDCAVVLADWGRRLPLLSLWVPLVAGARVVAAPEGIDGSALSRLISAEKASFVAAGPSGWADLVATGLRGGRGLRLVTAGGPLPGGLAGDLLSRARVVWNAYGSAATGECDLVGRVEDPSDVTAGRPVANTRAYVLDRRRQPAPAGVWGDLVIAAGAGGGGGGAPAGGGEPWHGDDCRATGDQARWRPDGRLQIAWWARGDLNPHILSDTGT
jgi:non-ribosomal peptide synthetase component F